MSAAHWFWLGITLGVFGLMLGTLGFFAVILGIPLPAVDDADNRDVPASGFGDFTRLGSPSVTGPSSTAGSGISADPHQSEVSLP